MKLIPIKCPLCGASLSIPESDGRYLCPYCSGLLQQSGTDENTNSAGNSIVSRTKSIMKEAQEIEQKNPDRAYLLVSGLLSNDQTDWRVFWYLCKNSDYYKNSSLFVGGFKYCNLSRFDLTMKFCTDPITRQLVENEYNDYWGKQQERWIQNPGEFPIYIDTKSSTGEYVIGRPNSRSIYRLRDEGDLWWYLEDCYVSWFEEIPDHIKGELRRYVAKGVQNAELINKQLQTAKYERDVTAFFNKLTIFPNSWFSPRNISISCAIGRTLIVSIRGSDRYDYAVPAKKFWD